MENQSKVHPIVYVQRDLLDIQRKVANKVLGLELSEEEETQYAQSLLNDEVAKYFDRLEKLRSKGFVKPFSFSSDGMIESYTMVGIHKSFLLS